MVTCRLPFTVLRVSKFIIFIFFSMMHQIDESDNAGFTLVLHNFKLLNYFR